MFFELLIVLNPGLLNPEPRPEPYIQNIYLETKAWTFTDHSIITMK